MRKLAVLLVLCAACRKEAVTEESLFDSIPINANSQILFLAQRLPNLPDWQLFLMNADGSNQHLITSTVAGCAKPVLSTSGSKIAFTTYADGLHQLYVVDTNGQNLTIVSLGTQYCGSPAWSPDDNRIAFVKSDDITGNIYNIYTVDATGTNEKKLTDDGTSFSPHFAPDGTTLFYSTAGCIYKMDGNGTGKQLLTPAHLSFGDVRPSTDGSKLALTSTDWGGSQIFVMNSNGTGLKQCTFTVSSRYFDTGYPRDGNCDPVWSPGSNEIAYVSWENGSPDIFVMKADGSNNKRLTDTPLRDEHPCWTADGRHILFSSNRNMSASWEIYSMTKDGRQQTPLTHSNTADIYPEFFGK